MSYLCGREFKRKVKRLVYLAFLFFFSFLHYQLLYFVFGPSRKHPSDWLPLEISLEKQQRIIYGFLNSSNSTNALKGPNLVHQGTLATVANSASDSGLCFLSVWRFDTF